MATMAATQLLMVPIRCSDSNPPRRGFGTKNNTNKVPTYVCMYVFSFLYFYMFLNASLLHCLIVGLVAMKVKERTRKILVFLLFNLIFVMGFLWNVLGIIGT
jgi:hypothetical protein